MTVVEKANENLAILTLESKLLQNNIISISGDITEAVATDFQNQIMYLISQKAKNIQIFINSYGGSVYAGLSIIDMIKYAQDRGIKVETVCTGVAMSMAAVILMVGSNRSAMKNSTIMFHEISTWCHGKITNIRVQVEETERLHKLLVSIIDQHSNLFEDQYLHDDLYLDAQAALNFDVIDKIQ